MRKRRTKKWNETVFQPLKNKIKSTFYQIHDETNPFAFGHAFLWAVINTGDGLSTQALIGSGCSDDWGYIENKLRQLCPEVEYTWINLD